MQLKHLKTILPPLDGACKITALTWSPSNLKLAVCTAERVVLLFDEVGERKDKFSTKPLDSKNGKKSYTVKGLAFSPDSSKIAVGQTDNMVYVYRVGDDWGEKKSICNKFLQPSSVTCIVWPLEGPLVIGLLDGSVHSAHIKTNKSQTLYSTNSMVVALASNCRGTGFVSGHADGTIVRFFVTDDGGDEPEGKLCVHPVPPYALAWPSPGVVVGGCDRRIVMYGKEGELLQQFDYSRDDTEKEFGVACASPSGHTVAFGSYDRLRIFTWQQSKGQWQEGPVKEIENLYVLTALGWKRDGSRLACGTLCGGVELFESVLKRSIWRNKFELTYVGASQVLVRPLSEGAKGVVLKSQMGYEINDVRIMGKDNYLVARTSHTLLLGDLQRALLSEIPWTGMSTQEKFYFDNINVCMVFNAGELTLVEYGNNDVLGSVRTEFVNPHLISVRINERKVRGVNDNKKLAYLLDLKTVSLVDLSQGLSLGQVNHEVSIDWLELNETGCKLLFRDRKQRLLLVDVQSLTKTSLLNYCTFVQWVPSSDVVVAQNRTSMCVWYNIDAPERVAMQSIKGEVVDVVKENGRTEVVVQEGLNQLGYPLDEGLVEFGTAIEDGDFSRAVTFLETMGGGDAESMWSSLGRLALESRQLTIAERCYAALGDMAKTQYLRDTISMADRLAKVSGGNGMDTPEVYARLAILEKQLKTAEGIFLEQNQLGNALQMYQRLHQWDQALQLAEAKGYHDLEGLKRSYVDWLLTTGQEEKAGELWEKEGDCNASLEMYLKAGLPVKASRLIQNVDTLLSREDIVTRVVNCLLSGGLYEQAGELYEKVDQRDKALECYRKGKAYTKAVELARYAYPSEVVKLEDEWGDHLSASKQLDAAINHYIEAGKTIKALDAAIGATQWKKAVQIIQVIDDAPSVAKYYFKLGQHFASQNDYTNAERYYLQGGMHKEAIDMYNQAGLWERAHRLASQHLLADEVAVMYVGQAQALEHQGRYRDAEKLYISVGEPDLAITMYKKQRNYDHMMRLVQTHHPDLVTSTHLHLAQELEGEGQNRVAEQHYLSAGDWKSAVNMYRLADMWEDAYRVAKSNGASQAGKQVAFLWARSLGGDSAVKLLTRFGLLEHSIDFACETFQFDFAFDLSRTSMQSKLPEIHYKYALALEDDGKFKEAEEQFVKASKPKEAVLMYVHNQDWESAQKVAELYDPDSVSDVLIGQAKIAFKERDLPKFESLLLRAHCPELAIKHYQEAGLWPDALRLCREYTPTKLPELQREYERTVSSKSGGGDVEGLLSQAKEWEEGGDYQRAIECYLRVTSGDVSTQSKAWLRAADLATKFLSSDQAVRAARVAGPRLIEIHQYSHAAQLYITADLIKEAVDAYISGEEWAKARKVARELDSSLETYVENCYKESLRSQGKAEQLADVDLVAALDLLADQGQWVRCLDTAKTTGGGKLLHKYVALYASHLIKSGNAIGALSLYSEYPAPAVSANLNIYRRLALDVFALPNLTQQEAYTTWAQLRDMLLTIYENLDQTVETSNHKPEFESLLLVAHYGANRCAFQMSQQTEKMVSKVSSAMLRHSDIIPCDKAFYEAGMSARACGHEAMAFVFFNRYLDLHEAVEEETLDMLDHSDFANTDIPYEFPIPEHPFLETNSTLHEDVKEWVLAISMDRRVDQTLPTDDRGCYEASLVVPGGTRSPPCIVTGYPVLRGRMEFPKGGRVAYRDDWNRLVMAAKAATNTGGNSLGTNNPLQDVVAFISRWCGGTPNYAFQ